MSVLRSCALALGLALLTAAPASASITALPTVQRTLSASHSSASCGAGATSTTTYTAPMAGFVTARLDAAGGEWDLYAGDARTHRSLGSSRAFGSHEVVQTWVSAGQRLLLTGCRTAGSVRSAAISIELLDAAKPAPRVDSLVRAGKLSPALMGKLAKLGFDVSESQYPDHTDIYVPSRSALGTLSRLGVRYRMRIADLGAYDRRFLSADAARTAAGATSPLPSGRTDYRYLSDYQADMAKIVADHPDVARPVTIGTSYQGRPIQGVEISKNVTATDDGKPTFFVMGIHHAREWPAGEAAIEYMTMLANDASSGTLEQVHGSDGKLAPFDVGALLSKVRVVVVPIINPDGFVSSRGDWAGRDQAGTAIPDPEDETIGQFEEGIVAGGQFAYRRKNCDVGLDTNLESAEANLVNSDAARDFPCYYQIGVDPNRNYGFDWGGPGASTDPESQSYHGPGQWSELETQAVWHYSQTHPVTALITLHTVAALVLRSPGLHTHGLAPDETLLKELGDRMAKFTGYTSEYGWQLYDTTGTTEDWNYGAVGTLGYTIEIGDSNGVFHDAYQQGVVDQWTGKAGTKLKGGLHDALLTAAGYAADPKSHAILTGTGVGGATLEVKKTFNTLSSPLCTVAQGTVSDGGVDYQGQHIPTELADCVAPGTLGQTSTPDQLDYTTTVPASGAFTWHITQSTRPFVGYKYDATTGAPAATGQQELWTLTCSVGGNVVKSQQVFIERGQSLDVGDACTA